MAGDLQPHAIRRRRTVQRSREIANAREVVGETAASVALREVLLELGAADRSQGAVGQLLNRADVPLTRLRHGSIFVDFDPWGSAHRGSAAHRASSARRRSRALCT
jgi:hypothetical protein